MGMSDRQINKARQRNKRVREKKQESEHIEPEPVESSVSKNQQSGLGGHNNSSRANRSRETYSYLKKKTVFYMQSNFTLMRRSIPYILKEVAEVILPFSHQQNTLR